MAETGDRLAAEFAAPGLLATGVDPELEDGAGAATSKKAE
jgi:hypothetical protein